jgi:protein ImuB
VRLAALVAERSEPVQLATAGLAGFADPAGTDEELSHLIDRLGARFGLRRVTRLVAQDTHIPEFAVAAVPASERRKSEGRRQTSDERGRRERSKADGGRTLLPPPFAGNVGAASAGSASEEALSSKRGREKRAWGREESQQREEVQRQEKEEQDTLCPARPVRLFGRPEPVDAVAEVPDGPPARFRWRRVLHEVAMAEGPERIAMEWWRDEAGRALTRDYFRVESRDGLRAWLYREGLYGGETAAPRWFLHGLFG